MKLTGVSGDVMSVELAELDNILSGLRSDKSLFISISSWDLSFSSAQSDNNKKLSELTDGGR